MILQGAGAETAGNHDQIQRRMISKREVGSIWSSPVVRMILRSSKTMIGVNSLCYSPDVSRLLLIEKTSNGPAKSSTSTPSKMSTPTAIGFR